MIVSFNVCDNCGNQNEIKEGDNQFRILFGIQPIDEYLKKGNRFGAKDFEGTFCDKGCLINYFKDYIRMNGELVKGVGENES